MILSERGYGMPPAGLLQLVRSGSCIGEPPLFEAGIEGQRPHRERAINTGNGKWMRRLSNHGDLTGVA
jgi:hypothetical protein